MPAAFGLVLNYDMNLDTLNPSVAPKARRNPAVMAWLRLVRVFQKVEHLSAANFRCHHLSGAQFDVLAHVGADEGQTQQKLADSLLVTKGNVCQLLDRMEQTGLLERRQEGRANRLFLTAEGRLLYEAVVPRQEATIAAALSALTPEEVSQLLTLLRKLDRSLE